MDEIHENCGVAAVHIKPGSGYEGKAPYFLYRLLLNMQNRGQLGAGITTYNPNRDQLIDTFKDLGTVNEVFRSSHPEEMERILSRYAGNLGIGHTRYATSGNHDLSSAQPFERHHGRKWKWFAFCFNGNIANFAALRQVLLDKDDYHITHDNDTEIIMHYLSREVHSTRKRPDFVRVFRNVSKKFDGAYNLAFIDATGALAVIRDPLGIRPMCYAHKKGVTLIASESAALKNCGFYKIKHLEPGEMVLIKDNKIEVIKYADKKKPKRCMFEWVYFANISSSFDGKSVYKARTRLGKELAKLETEKVNPKDYVVVPVPDSSKPAGEGFAYQLGLPSVEGLVRNRFVGRTFIEASGRHEKVRDKFNILRESVKGKKVLLVDDSIVRGTTSKKIVRFIKDVGKAKEVHLRISCPAVISPCFYGVDIPTCSELFAPKYKKYMKKGILPEDVLKKMAKSLDADSLIYQTVDGLVRAISFPKNQLCAACVTAEYITCWGKKLYKKSLAEAKKAKSKDL